MTRKRFQPKDARHDATLLEVQVCFRDGRIEEQAVRMEIRRLTELFLVNVIKWYLLDGRALKLYLHVPNRLCTDEEARQRNDRFDDMVRLGFPALGDLPAVPPRRLWRRHDIRPDQLGRVPCFMHMFSQAVCMRSRELQGRPACGPGGPHVAGRYVLVQLDPSRIHPLMTMPGLPKAVAAWFGKPPVPFRAGEACLSSAYAIGGRRFMTEQMATAPPFGARASKRARRLTVFDLDLAWHYAKETDAELKRLVNERIDAPTWAEELIGDLRGFCHGFGQDGNLNTPIALAATLPFVMLLHAVDGTMRWRKLRRMKADGTLDLLRAKAKENARIMLGLI